MPELHDILAAEAERRRPGQQPAFDALVRDRRQRDRRYNVVGVVVLAVAVVGIATGVTLRGVGGVGTPGGPGPTSTVAVTGQLLMVGGPPSAPAQGVPGTVVFEAANGQRTTIRTGGDGRFSTTLRPGRYTATGTSPQFGDGQGVCRTDRPVVVAPGHPIDILVACHRR